MKTFTAGTEGADAARSRREMGASRLDQLAFAMSVVMFLLMSVQTGGGTIRAALVLALLGLLIALNAEQAAKSAMRYWFFLSYPMIAAASAVWSIHPDISVRYGAQLIVTAFLAIHVMRVLGPRRFVLALFMSMFIFVALSLAAGRTGVSAAGDVLIGLAGSKNYFANYNHLLLVSALAVLLDANQPGLMRLAALPAIPLAAAMVFQSESAGGLIVTIVAAAAFLVLNMLKHMNRTGRAACIVTAVVVCAPMSALIPEVEAFYNEFQHTTLNKNETLSGRTPVWAVADDLIRARPILGYGYSSVWLDESTLGSGLRRMLGQASGLGVHFHDTRRQVLVDTGYLGLAIYLASLAAIAIPLVRRLYLNPSIYTAFFAAMFLSILARFFIEVLHGTYSMYYILMIAPGVATLMEESRGSASSRMRSAQRLQSRRAS